MNCLLEIDTELEGLVHVTEIDLEPTMKLEDTFKLGDAVKARVIKVDNEQRKIGLTMKNGSGVSTEQAEEAVSEQTEPVVE